MRNIPFIKLHSFNHIQSGSQCFRFFNRDNTIFSYFFHGICNNIANFTFSSRIRGNISNGFLVFNFNTQFLNFFHRFIYSLLNSSSQHHGICTGSNISHTFMQNLLSQNCCCSGTITGNIICFRSNFFYKLCSHIFKRIFYFNLSGYSNPIIGNGRRTIFLFQNNISAFWP